MLTPLRPLVFAALLLALPFAAAAGDDPQAKIGQADKLVLAFMKSSKRVPALMKLRALAMAWAKHQERTALAKDLPAAPKTPYKVDRLSARLATALAELKLTITASGPAGDPVTEELATGLEKLGYRPSIATGEAPKNIDARIAAQTELKYLGEQKSSKTGDPVFAFECIATVRVSEGDGKEVGTFRERYTYRARDLDKSKRVVVDGLRQRLREKSLTILDSLLKARPIPQ